MIYSFSFILLHLSFISMIYLFIISLRRFYNGAKNTSTVAFALMTFSISIWCLGQLLEVYTRYFTGKTQMATVYLYFTGMILVPYFSLGFCYTFVNAKAQIRYRWFIYLIPQLISLSILFTNDWTHLFIVKYSPINLYMQIGPYFKIHSLIISYPYIILGLYFLYYKGFFVKETSKLNSKQSFLCLLGILIPLIVNTLSTFKICQMPTYLTAVASIFTSVMWYIAILKYNFISSNSIAIRYIFDNISDSILVVSENLLIIDFNEKFQRTFTDVDFEKNVNIKTLRNKSDNPLNILNKLEHLLECETKNNRQLLQVGSKNKYFEVECIHVEKCNILIFKDVNNQHWQVIETIIKLVDAKNKYTSGHSTRVAEYAIKIGIQLGLDKSDVLQLWSCGIAHDIGKIGVPDEILNSDKRYARDSEEMKLLEKHVVIGASILGGLEEFREMQPIVLYHHERIDGKGYLGIKGPEIPLFSKIIAVADTYDAMSSGRKYQDKPIRECHEVLNILEDGSIGTQLDSECFYAFVEAMKREGYIQNMRSAEGKFIGTGKLHDFVVREAVSNKLIIREDYENDFRIDVDRLYQLLS
ncbi:HD domain-containing phosphohydrolase [Acetivibrio cellulolyticus]|uniref:HD domain-containing phosphohydrolase n=1 Tax=Acetivibrio cellulolyticus TaxID=35830 RepID=UPI0001E2BD53|nr:HD domain-containing phosphohydrolase [Acetivibrio cellulolyticus]